MGVAMSLYENYVPEEHDEAPEEEINVVIIVGAVSELATKYLYPSLRALYGKEELPRNTAFVGYDAEDLKVEDIRTICNDEVGESYLDGDIENRFWNENVYVSGNIFDSEEMGLNMELNKIEKNFKRSHRTFFVSVPPSDYPTMSSTISKNFKSLKGRTKVVIEVPPIQDTETMHEFKDFMRSHFKRKEYVMFEPCLNLPVVQDILSLRRENFFLSKLWDKGSIKRVTISHQEESGVSNEEAALFDEIGIIRDIMQSQMLQIMCVVGMEIPIERDQMSFSEEKRRFLNDVSPLNGNDAIFGQYTAWDGKPGYLDNPSVPSTSMTATFASVSLSVNNERWENVPFIMKANMASNETKFEVQIEFKADDQESDTRNELVIQLQPTQKITLRLNLNGELIELNETMENFNTDTIPYEISIKDLIDGGTNRAYFISDDDLEGSWRIFGGLLKDQGNERPISYPFGSLGPQEAKKELNSDGANQVGN